MSLFNKYVNWIFNPFSESSYEEDKKETPPTKIIIPTSKELFRPDNFTQYIGQCNAKKILANYIEGVKKRNTIFPHTLISGVPGVGKTTLARIIAIEMQVKYLYSIGSNIKNYEDIIRILELIDGGILMLDEVHSLPRELAEKFYPLMEDFKDCSPFTLIGATTELGEIIKDRKPFYDRFKIILELENYSIEDLVRIAVQFKNKVFKDDNTLITGSMYEILAKNCRGNPRTLIRLLEATVYFGGRIDEVLKSFGIIENGFTIKDLKILTYIRDNINVGLQNISNYLDTSQENYLYSIEPFLLKSGLIIRTGRGRKITSLGLKTIKRLENYVCR